MGFSLLSPIILRCGRTENTSRSLYVLLCDVIAYAEVCLPSRCLDTGCIIPLFYCCERVLLRKGCFCGSTVLARSKSSTLCSQLIFLIIYYYLSNPFCLMFWRASGQTSVSIFCSDAEFECGCSLMRSTNSSLTCTDVNRR
jgi:hypothetical protein